jgi:hypothetical protein
MQGRLHLSLQAATMQTSIAVVCAQGDKHGTGILPATCMTCRPSSITFKVRAARNLPCLRFGPDRFGPDHYVPSVPNTEAWRGPLSCGVPAVSALRSNPDPSVCACRKLQS